MYRLLATIFFVLSISTLGFTQTFLDKKCADLTKEIENRQQAIEDQQAYVSELQNDYIECASDKQSVEEAKTIVSESQKNAKTETNWSDLNAISSPVVTP